MNKTYEQELFRIIKQFGAGEILDKIIIIGSWATYFYSLIFDDFIPSIRTLDVDFYVPKTAGIGVKESVKEALEPINYDQLFDTDTQKSKFISPNGFEIEFLAKLKRDQSHIVKIEGMNVNAEQLGDLEIFDRGYINIDFEGYTIKVASPAAYIMQKIMISPNRAKEKYEKDLESILLVLSEIYKYQEHIDEFMILVNQLGKRTTKRLHRYINENDIQILKNLLNIS